MLRKATADGNIDLLREGPRLGGQSRSNPGRGAPLLKLQVPLGSRPVHETMDASNRAGGWHEGMLPHWRRTVLAYRLIGALPFGERLFDWYKVSLGGLRRFDLARRAYLLREMPMLLGGAQTTVEGKDLVEIGAGWHPLLPVLFHGMGARSIVMTDIRRHMRQHLVEQTVEYCLEHADEIAVLVGVDEATLRARWSALRPGRHRWLDVWESRGIAYAAPLDFRHSALPAESADIVYSNSCLNYVPMSNLQAIAAESARILRPGGRVLHDISVYDDLTSAQPSIPSWNFLKFGDDEWERIGNSRVHYQNRCRPRAYAALVVESGMRIVWDKYLLGSRAEPDLDRSVLHPRFRDLPDEEILCWHYLLAADRLAARSGSTKIPASRPVEQDPRRASVRVDE
jgi:SAM-dependent methyltransferase